jgi:hypothetical protein
MQERKGEAEAEAEAEAIFRTAMECNCAPTPRSQCYTMIKVYGAIIQLPVDRMLDRSHDDKLHPCLGCAGINEAIIDLTVSS